MLSVESRKIHQIENCVTVNQPLLDGNEKKYLIECIESGWISSDGPFIKKFEEQFSSRVGRQHGIAVCNGSVALDVAVLALGIGLGDEVIMPTFTIISCAAAIVRAGAIPVLVDSDPLTLSMDASKIEECITIKTKAIMVVHIYGIPVDMDPVLSLAKKYNLKIIEDAAEMHGQTYKGQPCGSFGDISTFSFYANKHVTTGEGGMIVTNDSDIVERCRSLRNLCFKPERRFVHDELGFNFRMTNMQAALGLAQLEQLDQFVEKKRLMGKLYDVYLCDVPGIQRPLSRTDYARSNYWVYGIVLHDEIKFDADQAIKLLAQKGIGCRPFFWCMHEQPVFKKMGLFNNERYPIAERLARRGFYLPSGMALSGEQIERSAQALKEILL